MENIDNEKDFSTIADEIGNDFSSYSSMNVQQLQEKISELNSSLKSKLEVKLNITDSKSYMQVEEIISDLVHNLRTNIASQKEGEYHSARRELQNYIEFGLEENIEERASKAFRKLEEQFENSDKMSYNVISRILDDTKLKFNYMVDPMRNGRCYEEKADFSRTLDYEVMQGLLDEIKDMDKKLLTQARELVNAKVEQYKQKQQELEKNEESKGEKEQEKEEKNDFINELKSSTYSKEEINENQNSREENESLSLESKEKSLNEDLFK